MLPFAVSVVDFGGGPFLSSTTHKQSAEAVFFREHPLVWDLVCFPALQETRLSSHLGESCTGSLCNPVTLFPLQVPLKGTWLQIRSFDQIGPVSNRVFVY